MVTLVDVSYVRGRLGLQDDPNINASINFAIGASTPLLEAKLGTAFSKRSVVDTFYVNSAYPKKHGNYLLKLSGGFVRSTPSMTALYGDSMQLIADTLDLTECLLNSELGHLYVPESYEGSWIKVSYDAGFDEGEGIPEWLVEAATVHTISLLSAQQIGDPKPELSEVFDYMMKVSTSLLDAHLRTKSHAISPL